jgi:pimeloyl-ACP methyl ester carboxylesterase
MWKTSTVRRTGTHLTCKATAGRRTALRRWPLLGAALVRFGLLSGVWFAAPAALAAAGAPAAANPPPGSDASLALAIGANLATSHDLGTALATAFVSAPNARVAIDPAGDPGPAELAAKGVDQQLRLEVGPPAASLLVWILRPPASAGENAPGRGTILFLHGICSSRLEHLGHARYFAARGYTAILPDLRGQGRSTGAWFTYGWQEARDMQQVLDQLLVRGVIQKPIGVLGASYGAATANLLAAIDPRLDAVVSMASYTSMREVVPQYIREFVPFLAGMLSPQAIQDAVTAAGRLADFSPDAASPLEAVRRHRVPTLFLHGEKDANIPYRHAEQLAAAAQCPCRLLAVPGGSHYCGGSDFVRAQAEEWFAQHLRPPAQAR